MLTSSSGRWAAGAAPRVTAVPDAARAASADAEIALPPAETAAPPAAVPGAGSKAIRRGRDSAPCACRRAAAPGCADGAAGCDARSVSACRAAGGRSQRRPSRRTSSRWMTSCFSRSSRSRRRTRSRMRRSAAGCRSGFAAGFSGAGRLSCLGAAFSAGRLSAGALGASTWTSRFTCTSSGCAASSGSSSSSRVRGMGA